MIGDIEIDKIFIELDPVYRTIIKQNKISKFPVHFTLFRKY
jgi:hypothetical protein